MLLYHGSKNKFDKFSFDYKGLNGSSEGEGVYLTTSKKIAFENYGGDNGYTYTVLLKENKELSSHEITLETGKIVEIINHIGAYDVLINYDDVDYYGIECVMDMALDSLLCNKNDNDIITDLCMLTGDDKKVLEAVATLGYTHTRVKANWGYDKEEHEIFVVYDLNALEILEIEQGEEVIL